MESSSLMSRWSERIDDLSPRTAVLGGLGVGAAVGFGATLHLGVGVAVYLGLGALIVPWVRRGRPRLAGTTPAPAPRKRTLRLDVASGPVEVTVIELPGGVFTMGSEHGDEGPPHSVHLPPFAMQEVPVTRRLYAQVTGRAGGDPEADLEAPVTRVSWFDAVRFCNLASDAAGLTTAYRLHGNEVHWQTDAEGFRLPLEAEWEYAVRAGSTDEYFFDPEDAERFAWFGDPEGRPRPVASRVPNRWGLHDMAGNAWEWCWDRHDSYDQHVTKMTDPAALIAVGEDAEGPAAWRVLRGGSFDTPAWGLRSACRYWLPPGDAFRRDGFRCVLGSRPQPWSF